jgi:Family of unknown function (DUF6221)
VRGRRARHDDGTDQVWNGRDQQKGFDAGGPRPHPGDPAPVAGPEHYVGVTDRDNRENDQRVDTLARFLLARLHEDERIAQAARDADVAPPSPTAAPDRADLVSGLAVHIARHDPARVLLDVAAKRAVVQTWLVAVRRRLIEHLDPDAVDMAETAIAHLAAVYADHPDYRQAWLPTGGSEAGEPDDSAAGDDKGRRSGNVIALRPREVRRHRHHR